MAEFVIKLLGLCQLNDTRWEKKKALYFSVSSEDHNPGDDVKKKVEAPSNFLRLSSDSFSCSHFI